MQHRLAPTFASPSGTAEWPMHGVPGAWGAEDTRYFQVAYRDGEGPCGWKADASNGLRVQFQP